MNERPLVVIYGYTPRMLGIEASLLHGGGLEVVRADSLGMGEEAPSPDLILFDLSHPDGLQVFSRCDNGVSPILVGLCPGGEKVILFPGGARSIGTVTELDQFLQSLTTLYH